MNRRFIFRLFLIWILYCFTFKVSGCLAQEYGLELIGHEENPDQRTRIDLGGDAGFSFDNSARVSFDIRFKKNVRSYFGYVFRFADNEGNSLDLMFKPDTQGNFRLVADGGASQAFFSLDSARLYSQWTRLDFLFSKESKEIVISTQGKVLQKIAWKKTLTSLYGCFGGSMNPKFLTSDVLPCYLRDIRLELDEKSSHHWPLDESSGSILHDRKGDAPGRVSFGIWLKHKHYAWLPLLKRTLPSWTSTHFDPSQRAVVVHHDQGLLIQKSGKSLAEEYTFSSKIPRFTYGDQVFYQPTKKEAGLIRPQTRDVYSFSLPKKEWNMPPVGTQKLTEFWHHNVYVYPNDTAVVLMGGYGMFTYKNQFLRYSYPRKSWDTLHLKGDFWAPRYLFGLGTNQSGTKSYVFGGYGSESGQQEVNSSNLYDLYEIDWVTETIRKIYTLQVPDSPFVVAQSLIIDEQNEVFYALVYNQLSFSTSLRLIKASLKKPSWEYYGTSIPYKFHDIASFANLFFDQKNKVLVAVLSYYDRLKAQSSIEMYSLDFPPVHLEPNSNVTQYRAGAYWVGGGAILLLAFLCLGFGRKKWRKKSDLVLFPTETEYNPRIMTSAIPQSQVYLFGGFTFTLASGHDITSQFTPLLKEIFLYLLLHMLVKKKSIHTVELDEVFWFDKTTNSARNNRSVNLTKLKSILDQVPGIDLKKDKGNWSIALDSEQVNIDYVDFLGLVKGNKLTSSNVQRLNLVVGRGAFLAHVDFTWLDPFLSETSFQLIEAYMDYVKGLTPQKNAVELIDIADKIFLFDPVDETAMEIKCRALICLGKHSLAKECYANFTKEYEAMYNQPFFKSFHDVMEG